MCIWLGLSSLHMSAGNLLWGSKHFLMIMSYEEQLRQWSTVVTPEPETAGRGALGWLRRLTGQLVISAQIQISGSGVPAPHWAPCQAWPT